MRAGPEILDLGLFKIQFGAFFKMELQEFNLEIPAVQLPCKVYSETNKSTSESREQADPLTRLHHLHLNLTFKRRVKKMMTN